MPQNATEISQSEGLPLNPLVNTNLRILHKVNDVTVVPEVAYVETQEPELVQQYLDIREQAYRERLGLTGFDGRYDKYDTISNIFVAMQGDAVIGGARMTVCNPKVEKILLPSEEENFIYRDLFPELDLENNLYCEFTRLALLKGFRNGEYSVELQRQLINKCKSLKVKYIFALATKVQARSHKQIYKNNFNVDINIRRDINVPTKQVYKDIGMEIFILTAQLY